MTTVARQPIHTVSGGGGLRLHGREWATADAPPVPLIHRWSQNRLCWRRQFAGALADEFRLVACNRSARGVSGAPRGIEDDTSGRLSGGEIVAIIDALRLHRPVLVGWSCGAFVICAVAHRVRAVVAR